MKRTLLIFAFCAVAAMIVFAGLGYSGVIDMKQRHASMIPDGAVPHGGKEKPIIDQTTGSARR
jgi:hypothetical protein